MSPQATRWLLFTFFVVAMPFPMLGMFAELAPPLRYWMLFGATGAVAMQEGAAGPVPGLLILLGGHALAGTLVAAGLAWLSTRVLLRSRSLWFRRTIWTALVLWLAMALLFDVYETALGPFQRANLIGALS